MYRNTEILQEQLHSAHAGRAAAEQQAAEADQLRAQLNSLQSQQQTWDKVLQVSLSEKILTGFKITTPASGKGAAQGFCMPVYIAM